MKIYKTFFYLAGQYKHIGITLLILIVLALHFTTIMEPAQPVFDEKYYIPSARLILTGEGTDRIEHPPLGQLIIASGIKIFGDNPFGWRIFPVLFGASGIIFFYLICRRSKLASKYAFLAAFLLAFENLSFIQSGVGMLDVFSLTLMLAALWLYLRGNYIYAGIAAGLATLAKLTGILVLPVILAHWLLTSREKIGGMSLLLVSATAIFFVSMPLLEYIIWHKWLNPFSQISFFLKANTLATIDLSPSDMFSRPWDWIIRPEILTYWIEPHYLAMISPTIWALIIPAISFAIYRAFRGDSPALLAVLWFAFTCLVWIPISLITDRISYIYYFYPSVGSVCLSIAIMAGALDSLSDQTGQNRTVSKLIAAALPLYILLHLGAFVLLSPIAYIWKLPLAVAAYLVARHCLSVSHYIAMEDTSRKRSITGEGL